MGMEIENEPDETPNETEARDERLKAFAIQQRRKLLNMARDWEIEFNLQPVCPKE